MAQPANPLRYEEVTEYMEVAVYIPGLSRPLYGVVKGKWETFGPNPQARIQVEVFRFNQTAMIEVDLAQIVPW